MANAIYPKAKEHFMKADIDLDTATIKAALIDTGVYSYNAAHEFFSSVTGVVGTPIALASITPTSGVLDAADIVFPTVTGASVEALIIFNDTGNAATSHLIAFMDTGAGFPITPNGGNINIAWDNGLNKIFAL